MPKKLGAKPAPENDSLAVETVQPTVQETRAEIRSILRPAGATVEQQDEFVDAVDLSDHDAAIDQARSAAYDLLTQRSGRIPPPRIEVRNAGPSPEQTRALRVEGLAVRIAGGTPSEGARQYVGYGVFDHAREMLEGQGTSTRGMTVDQLMTRAMTVSEFPELLTGTGARILNEAHKAARAASIPVLTRKVSAADFRSQSMLQLSEHPRLLKVGESGEVQSGSLSEQKDVWALETFARIISLSRKAIINDDLNAWGGLVAAAGAAAAATEADLVIEALVQSSQAGPVMGDGVRMLHATHNNRNTEGWPIEIASISNARVAMRMQKGLDGQTVLDFVPDTLLVTPSNETRAEQLVAEIFPDAPDSSNPFTARLKVVVEPRLQDVNEWDFYLLDSRRPPFVLGGLAGYEGPQFAQREGFDVLGREFRVHQDIGVGGAEWRSIFLAGGHSDSNSAGEG